MFRKASWGGYSNNFSLWILDSMPDDKKKVLVNACGRNNILTSAFVLEFGKLTTYKEGWYVELKGTRSGFKVWAFDNDGELVFGRKPNDSKLHKLWSEDLHFSESDFDVFVGR